MVWGAGRVLGVAEGAGRVLDVTGGAGRVLDVTGGAGRVWGVAGAGVCFEGACAAAEADTQRLNAVAPINRFTVIDEFSTWCHCDRTIAPGSRRSESIPDGLIQY